MHKGYLDGAGGGVVELCVDVLVLHAPHLEILKEEKKIGGATGVSLTDLVVDWEDNVPDGEYDDMEYDEDDNDYTFFFNNANSMKKKLRQRRSRFSQCFSGRKTTTVRRRRTVSCC